MKKDIEKLMMYGGAYHLNKFFKLTRYKETALGYKCDKLICSCSLLCEYEYNKEIVARNYDEIIEEVNKFIEKCLHLESETLTMYLKNGYRAL